MKLSTKLIYDLSTKIKFLPKGVVYLVDLSIVFACSLSVMYGMSLITSVAMHQPLSRYLIVIVLNYALFQYLFGSHTGIIRYSGFSDVYRLIKVNLCAMVLSVICFSVINHFTSNHHFYILFSILNCIIIAAVQIMMRVVVRLGFESVWKSNRIGVLKNSLIMGCDRDAMSIALFYGLNMNSIHRPLAFVDFGHRSSSSDKIRGLPILGIQNIDEYIELHKIRSILISTSKLNDIPQELFDNFIRQGLELIKVDIKKDDKQEAIDMGINNIKIEDLLGRNSITLDKEKLQYSFDGKTIMITGAAGSIGSEIAYQVAKFQCKRVIILDQAETFLNDLWLDMLGTLGPESTIEIIPVVASVTNSRKMRQVFESYNPQIIFHAAAYKHVPMMELHPCTAVATNLGGTKIVADLAVEFNTERFVMISTDKAVNPTNVMGASKRAAEIYIQSLFHRELERRNPRVCQMITTRFGNVLGSNGSVVPLFKKQIEKGGPITITHRDIIRYFMSIPEACSLVLEAGCCGQGGHIYIFDMGDAVRIYDLACKMIALSGKIPDKDIKIVETGLRPGEKLYEELLSNKEITLPTYHKKIMIAQVATHKYEDTLPLITQLLEEASRFSDYDTCVKSLKKLIPEFKSKNSMFERLDAHIVTPIIVQGESEKVD